MESYAFKVYRNKFKTLLNSNSVSGFIKQIIKNLIVSALVQKLIPLKSVVVFYLIVNHM